MKEGLDVLLVHPRLVQTGLDLVDFPTIVWHEVEYSVYTMRQASRRSWRIGQRLPVRVVYLAYRGTLQTRALTLVAKKLQASLAVEGELTEDGLASFGDDGEDLLLALARTLTEQVEASDDSLEGLFISAREASLSLAASLEDEDIRDSAEASKRDMALVEAGAPQRERVHVALDTAGPIRPQPSQVTTGSAQQLRLF